MDGGLEPIAGYGHAPYVKMLAFEWPVVPVSERARARAGIGCRPVTGG